MKQPLQLIFKAWGIDNFNNSDVKRINNPNWVEYFESSVHVHDWRTYIPDEIKGYWVALNEEAKYIAYAMAEMQASQEEWD